MTGVMVLIVVLVLLTTRSRKARRRWIRVLTWLWWVLAWAATLVLPRSPAGRGKQVVRTTRTAAAPTVPRVIRKRRPWPVPPLPKRKYAPGDDRPGQGPRYFTPLQKAELLRRAGHQCQHTTLGIRCHRTTELRADHLHPYSWGGKTIIENGQILCDPHNVEKGAHWTDVRDPALLELVCVPHMLPRNRFRNRRRRIGV